MAGKKGRRGWGWIRRLPSQRYQATYVGPDVVRHRAAQTFSRRMDAERWLADERVLIERGEWTSPSTRSAARRKSALSVADYITTWIDHRDIKPRTKSHYRAILAQHISPTLGKVAVINLTPEAVRSWHAATLADRPVMRTHAYGLLHAAMATAQTDALIPTNPCHIPRATVTNRKRLPVILDVPEVGKLADLVGDRFRALVLISAWCGLRWGEVIELRRKDISEDCSLLSVERGATHREGCRVDTPKSGRGRSVVVPPHIRLDLKHHLDTLVGNHPEALAFPPTRVSTCHLNDKTFRHHFTPAVAAIGREGVRIHDLRHFAGTQAARVGSLVETMARLGHSTASASLRYQAIARGRDAEVADALSRLAETDTP